MKRRVLVITNPGEKGEDNYCGGVYVDGDNYKNYFKAPYGGYWSESEITILDKPSKTTVQTELNNLTDHDFSIIIFCGHGWYSSLSASNILTLNKTESLDSNDLRKNANKRIIILDSCRKVHKEYITDEILKSRMMSESLLGLSKLNPLACKEHYIETINMCPKQLIVGYAANLNELAGDSQTKGGFYSSSLIKASVDWVDNSIGSIVPSKNFLVSRFPSRHDNSAPLVEKLSGNTQHPQIEKPRVSDTNDYLPFGILA